MDSAIPFMFVLIFFILLALAITVLLIIWPIQVAKKRELEPNMITAITLISIIGTILFGIGWIVAVIMAYTLPTKELKEAQLNIDKLAKLGQLYKQGIITKEEFDRQKAQLLK